ncbi:hypothetical protein TCAL_16101 [Tigriopus californicus]|uniref:Uncharacterized protein n=1 Tax=Tigriopus californicus TaxID=6832 RepID=A0A553PQ63_TIGCA|nr:hypothetical protein TCAL_16101 [Tigriopus californicus]
MYAGYKGCLAAPLTMKRLNGRLKGITLKDEGLAGTFAAISQDRQAELERLDSAKTDFSRIFYSKKNDLALRTLLSSEDQIRSEAPSSTTTKISRIKKGTNATNCQFNQLHLWLTNHIPTTKCDKRLF